MDMSFIEGFIPDIAAWLNVQPSTVLLAWAIIALTSNAVSRAIPDTATGFLGGLRRITAVVGVHVPNKIAPSTTLTDVVVGTAKAEVAERLQVPSVVREYLAAAEREKAQSDEG